jgi:putative oxidoreductase
MSWNVATRRPALTVRSYEIPAADDSRPAQAGIGERIHRIAFSTAPRPTVLIRAIVGAVFLLEGCLKFLDPQGLGVGRFVKIGIPFPSFSAPFVGVFEIACGMSLMLGLLTRVAAIPMIANMIVAITTTKIPLLLHEGFWKAAHEARLDVAMLLGCVFLLLVGAGPLSLDSLLPASPRHRRHRSL